MREEGNRNAVTKTMEEQRDSRNLKPECKTQRSEGNLANRHATDRNRAGQRTKPDDADNAANRRMRLLQAKQGSLSTLVH